MVENDQPVRKHESCVGKSGAMYAGAAAQRFEFVPEVAHEAAEKAERHVTVVHTQALEFRFEEREDIAPETLTPLP